MRFSAARSSAICFAVLAAGLLHHSADAEDTLFQLRDEVRTEDPRAPAEQEPPRQHHAATNYDPPSDWNNSDINNDDSWDLNLVLVAAGVTAVGATAPLWGPPALIGDTYTHSGYFPRYPYKNKAGYMWIGEPVGDVYVLGVRARSDYGTNFGRFDWIGGNLLVESTLRWGAEVDFRALQEQRPQQPTDSLTLGDANLFYRFAQSDQFQGRAGVGFNYLTDNADTNFGFNFTYAVDWYPVKPVVVSAELDLGWLGQESLFHFRVTEGVNWKYGEAYVGYDYYDVGNFQVGGMVAGVRLWF